MIARPSNHVTRAMDANRRAMGSSQCPAVPRALLEWLERTHPPRCRRPGEEERAHERYAGQVDLIRELRAEYDKYADFTDARDRTEEALAETEGDAAVTIETDH